jgi:hypothetical protein
MLEFLLPKGLIEADPPSWFAVVGSEPFSWVYDGKPRPAPEDAATRILILEAAASGVPDAFVSHYDEMCGFIGDFWFATREAAIEDAAAEYGQLLDAWTPIPDDEPDSETFALQSATKRGQG